MPCKDYAESFILQDQSLLPLVVLNFLNNICRGKGRGARPTIPDSCVEDCKNPHIMAENLFANWNIGPVKVPLIIAGPCSAESEAQVLNTARALQSYGITIFRAGLWKPRSRPASFAGVGSRGIEWLQRVQNETGMKTAVEVANAQHVRQALRGGVDILWIGARTSANPFAIQEIADALEGVDIPVFIKNPVNPDLDLWQGAVERITGAGISRVGLIHRGFSTYEKTRYRNAPHWQLAIELRRRLPHLPMLCDPSHISGRTEILREVSQKAIDLNYDGLIIESHCNPPQALSDAGQQLSPQALHEMLQSLVLRNVHIDPALKSDIEELRRQIDRIDEELLNIIEERMNVSKQIGQYKKENNITILQPARWHEILRSNIEKGAARGLSEEFVSRLLKAIHQESINKQMEIMNR